MDGRELLAGRYELRGVLGHGGMAEVRDGWDTRLNRAVAIKLLYSALNAQPDVRRRFEHEARAAAGLSHPNIVAVHDYGEHDGRPFIVMERLPGHTLADQVARGPLHSARVRAVLGDVLSALTVAHAAGVLHRDLKPANILVSANGDAMKVADFGIAKTAGAAQTATGQIVGTMAYLSPERVAGAPGSVADDLYAVGVIGYEALTGRPAFPQDNPAALARAIMDTPPPPLAASRPDLEPSLAAVIDRAMARDRRRRFPDADHMRAALSGGFRPATKMLTDPLAPSASYFVPTRPRGRFSRRARTVLVAAAALVVLTVTGLAVALDSSSVQTPQPVGTSTSSTTSATTYPTSSSTAPSTETAVDEQPPQTPEKRGNGHGKKKGAD
ncbi:MAG: serine/threonine protein kinase [Mycobacterium sp.]|jgi:serine/threonine-protein kinase|nr:serine/threonine protein kinase [Mycobacterium sp.]